MSCITFIPLHVAAYAKLLIQRQGLILRKGRPKRTTDRPVGSNGRVVRPAESRGRVGGRGATSPLPSPRSQFTYFLRGIIWVRMIGTAQQMHELSMSILFCATEVLPLIFKFNLDGSLCFLLSGKKPLL